MELKWTIICLIGAVLILGNSENWMAGGNFNQEEFGILRAKVDNFNKASQKYDLQPAARTMSNDLNDLWKPAWNVIIVRLGGTNYDAVLYGYAFNQRWFWFNGFLLTGGNYISFIIWKDFNCVAWLEFDQTSGIVDDWSFSNAEGYDLKAKLQSDKALPIRNLDDIWKVAQDVQSNIPFAELTVLQDPLAYTIIASQDSSAEFIGRFCAVNYAYFNNIGKLNGADNGAVLVLKMRSS